MLFLVLKAARYVDETETVEFGEIDVFMGEDFVVAVRHGEAAALGEVRRRLEGNQELLRRGAMAFSFELALAPRYDLLVGSGEDSVVGDGPRAPAVHVVHP